MVKRSFIVVVVLAAALLAPAVAAADHPWDPPAWWTEAISGGVQTEGPFANYDCVLHQQERGGWSQHCARRYPGGYLECGGQVGHRSSTNEAFWGYGCSKGVHDGAGQCRRSDSSHGVATGPPGDSGWVPADCFERLKDGTAAPDGEGDDRRGGGSDLVSVCGTARFDWHRSNFGKPDVEKGEEACIHTVSNRVARQLAADGLRKMPEVFGQRLVEWAQGKLVPDPEDLIQRALPAWDRAFRTAGRVNVITRIGEAVGVAGVALGYRFAAKQIADKDACVMFLTAAIPNYTPSGTPDGRWSFGVNGWQIVYNRKNVKHPKRDAELHTANVSQKYGRRLRRDTWETRMTSMRCGKGGRVFRTKKHDDAKIVSDRVRAAG